MRTVTDIFGQIFRNLWAHKLRSFLTMFGIAWGVGSLLLLVGVGEGFRSGNKRELAEFGKEAVLVGLSLVADVSALLAGAAAVSLARGGVADPALTRGAAGSEHAIHRRYGVFDEQSQACSRSGG